MVLFAFTAGSRLTRQVHACCVCSTFAARMHVCSYAEILAAAFCVQANMLSVLVHTEIYKIQIGPHILDHALSRSVAPRVQILRTGLPATAHYRLVRRPRSIGRACLLIRASRFRKRNCSINFRCYSGNMLQRYNNKLLPSGTALRLNTASSP